MVKSNIIVRGVNHGQAARVLVQSGFAKREAAVRQQLKRASLAALEKYKKKCKRVLLPLAETSDQSFEWLVDDIHRLLQTACDLSPAYAELVCQAIDAQGNLPITLL